MTAGIFACVHAAGPLEEVRMSCPTCESPDSEVVSEADRHNKPLTTRMCLGCGLVYNDPIPSDAELSDFYTNRYRVEYKGAYHPRGRQIVRNFRRVRDHFDTFGDVIRQAGFVLDVGAGSGEFLFAVAAQADAIGIEPNQSYADYCRSQLHLDVRTDELRPDLFAREQFDFIRLNHVLEHLNDPVGSLRMIAGFLKPNGVFYVEVPNIEQYSALKSTGNMFHYGHIFNFNPFTLRAAAGLAGLVEIEATRERCANTTGVFLQKTDSPWTSAQTRNRENANRVKQAIEGHFAAKPVAEKLSRLGRLKTKLQLRAGETMVSLRHKNPAEIGRAILR